MPTHLVDKSALARRATQPQVREQLDPLLLEGALATCAIIDLEVLYSASSPSNYTATAEALRGMPRVAISDQITERALEVQGLLAERSEHRAVTLPDLLIAACAEAAGLSVMHYDADFDRIAKLTGQPVQWVVPRGSVS